MPHHHKRLRETLRTAVRRGLKHPKAQKYAVRISPEAGEVSITWDPESTAMYPTNHVPRH